MIRKFLPLLFVLFITACSSGEDNSEPPAELVDFKPSVTVTKNWQITVGDGVLQQYLKLFPLLLKDRLIVADRDGTVSAINPDTGKDIWATELDTVLSGGIGGDSKNHYVTSRDGELISLSADGSIQWRVKISSEVLAPVAVTDKHIIVRSIDGKVTALLKDTGAEAWLYKRDIPALTLRGTSRPLASFGRIYNALDNGHLVVLDDTDGRTLLDLTIATPGGRSELERIVDIDGHSVIENGVLYMASYQGRVVAIDLRQGQLIWSRKMSSSSGVEVSGSTVFVTDARDHVWALDRNNGATLWKQEKMQFRNMTMPVKMGDMMVVADNQGFLHWISQYDGHFIARVRINESGIIVPPLVKGNQVFVVSRSGEITAYQVTMKAPVNK